MFLLCGLALIPIAILSIRPFAERRRDLAIPAGFLAAALLLGVGFVWVRFVRGPATPRRLLVSMAAALCLYVVFGKVFSPQYLIWLLPVVAVVPRRAAPLAIIWLAAVLLLTNAYVPIRYFDLVDRLDTGVAAIVLLRNFVLLGLALYLVRAAGIHAEPEDRPPDCAGLVTQVLAEGAEPR